MSATVLFDGTRHFLAVTAAQGGFDGADPASALTLGYTVTGSGGVDPSVGATQTTAVNSSFSIDGLQYRRRSNVLTDALPGTTLTLRAANGKKDTLTLASDSASTEKNIQSYLTAYNAVVTLLQAQNTVGAPGPLAGDPTTLGLKSSLQDLVTHSLGAAFKVRSLADLGVLAEKDGMLTVDMEVLKTAVQRDPSAVDAIFTDPVNGIGKLTADLVESYTSSTTGMITLQSKGLDQKVTQLDQKIETAQEKLKKYEKELTLQFAAMQSALSSFQSVSDFLTMQEAAANRMAK